MLFAVIDTETTGLLKHPSVSAAEQPRVIEFAGILTDGDDILDELVFRANPGEPLEAIITKITGITDEALSVEGPFAGSVGKLTEFLSKAQCAIAHNMSFDSGMLNVECARMHIDLDDIGMPKLRICTVEQTMPHFGRRMKLGELFERAVGPIKNAHTAMGDVRMLHEVCKVYGIYDALKAAHA